MGISFQAVAVGQATMDTWRADGQTAQEFIGSVYTDNGVTDDQVLRYLDKSGMGIMEAFGIIDQSAVPPDEWILGREQLEGTDGLVMVLNAAEVQQVATMVAGVSDDDFAARAANNMMDQDVEYLAHFFAHLREFYRCAAERQLAAAFYTSL